MSRIRIALVGLGAIGRKHLELVEANSEFELVAACARTDGKRGLVERNGVSFFTDYRTMLAQAKPEAVIDSSPTPEHCNVAVECARHGAHLLIEKPLAATIDEGEQIVQAVDAAGIRVLVGHHRRHNPLLQAAQAAVARGNLGVLKLAISLWTALKPDQYYDIEWRTGTGGGPLLTNLVHDLDALRFICGDVDSVSAFTSSQTRGLRTSDTASAILRFKNGAMGNVAMSDVVAAPWAFELTSGEDSSFPNNDQNHLMLLGTEGSLAVPRMELWRHPGGRESGWRGALERSTLGVSAASPLERQLQHFGRVVRGDEAPLVTARDGLRSLALALAIEASGRLGHPVRPDDLAPPPPTIATPHPLPA